MFDNFPQIRIRCSLEGCRKEHCWRVYNRRLSADVDYCDDHVPPLKTPRMSRYRYDGAMKFYSPVVDPVLGDYVVTNLGGRRTYGVVIGFQTARGDWLTVDPTKKQWPLITGINVRWQGWKEESLPTHCLRKISALGALAMCAEDETSPEKRHHKR